MSRPLGVVGVGVCRDSFASLERLFSLLPTDTGAAFMIAVRDRDGLHVDTVLETLAKQGRMPVAIAVDGEAIRPDRIYIGGHDALFTAESQKVRSRPSDQPAAQRGAVDSLLLSIAETFHERTIALILDGLGSDGTAGVAATKSCGGLALAEAIDGEEPADEAITALGIADLRLPVREIPAQVVAYLGNLRRVEDSGGWDQLQEEAEGQISRIAAILRIATGNDFHGYKRNTFLRRVARRMQVCATDRIEAYIERLQAEPAEVQHLFQDLLIGVTHFFRDPQEFEVLEQEVIPNLFRNRGADQRVRLWVVGCATGEEAYSLGILLREHMATLEAPPQVQIFATDLDARALAVARSGRYSDSILRHVSPERLMRWFVKEGETYRVAKELREMCIFSPHNVLKDAPFSKVDIVSCRNLLIYLNTELQTRVIPIFHFALSPGGYLFLGNAENVSRHARLFAPLDKKNRVFRRLETPTRILPDFPLAPRRARSVSEPSAPAPRTLTASIGRRAEQVAERLAPAYVVVDEQGEVLHFSGRTGRLLEPSAGAASLNILSLVHRALRMDLKAALHKAVTQLSRVETPRVALPLDGQSVAVSMVVEPISNTDEPTCLIVMFQEAGPVAPETLPPGDYNGEDVQRLEAELRITKDRLESTIEELESTNEELKSSNEEYQSINEELQSANEELETSKEELHSVNEELQTVNQELATRLSELGRTNSDIKNLLESTQIATVFLANDLKVRSFTPAAVEVFHLLETDAGRPIHHIASRVAYPELEKDAREVLRTLRPIEREVKGIEENRCFRARVLPYRSVDNVIAGVVVTFMDVTAAIKAEAATRESEARFRALFELSSLGQAQVDPVSLEIRAMNVKLPGILGHAAGKLLGAPFTDFLDPEDRPAVLTAWKKLQRGSLRELSIECRLVHREGHPVWVHLSAALQRDEAGEPGLAAVVLQEVGERRSAEARQQMLLAELQHRVRNTMAVIRQITRRTAETSDNVPDYAAHLEGRINALARTQSVLTRSPGDGVSLRAIVNEELLAHAADEEQTAVAGPEVKLRAKAAETFGLAVHELATNSIKYGALSQPTGKLEVEWTVSGPKARRVLRFVWREKGCPPMLVPAPRRRGFGLTLIERTVPYELGAEASVDFVPGGLICNIEMPLGGDSSPELEERPADEPNA